MSRGFVYILDNPALDPDLLKIGKTTVNVDLRAKGLSTTGLPEDFRVLYSIGVPDCHLAEAIAHKRLSEHRVRLNREFFRVTLERARDVLDDIAAIANRDDGREALAKEFGGSAADGSDIGLRGEARFVRQLQRCPDYVREMYQTLDEFVLGLGDVVGAVEPKGEGKIYRRGTRPFCRMDPKFRDAWIGVKIQGVQPELIETIAKVRDRQEKYWIYMTDPEKVYDLKSVLKIAYDQQT